jgi:hypothetical protein
MTYKQWMSEVDALVSDSLGMSIHDLPDVNFQDSFEAGCSPKDFVQCEVRDMVDTDFGSEFADLLDP